MCVDTRSTAAATLRASFSLNVNFDAFLKEINACPYIFAFSCKQPNNGLNIKNELFAIVLLYLSLFWLYSITALASRIASLYRHEPKLDIIIGVVSWAKRSAGCCLTKESVSHIRTSVKSRLSEQPTQIRELFLVFRDSIHMARPA